MKLVSVAVTVSLTIFVSADAWPDVGFENSASGNLIFGALGSVDAAAPCKCAIPRECATGNTCECFNNAAVSCWLENGQSCRLDLQNCGAPNSPPTSTNSEFPPCLANAGAGGNPLPPCAVTASCRRLDSSCYDWNWNSSGGCIGICVPKTLGQKPKASKQAQPPKQSGPSWRPQSTQPAGPNWGTPVAAGTPPPVATQWSPPPGGPSSVNLPSGGPPLGGPPSGGPQSGSPPSGGPTPLPLSGPPSFGACPANIKCPGNNVCTPDPKNRNTFLCLQPLESCGTFQNVQCQSNKTCVADPRVQCKGQGCTGLCV